MARVASGRRPTSRSDRRYRGQRLYHWYWDRYGQHHGQGFMPGAQSPVGKAPDSDVDGYGWVLYPYLWHNARRRGHWWRRRDAQNCRCKIGSCGGCRYRYRAAQRQERKRGRSRKRRKGWRHGR